MTQGNEDSWAAGDAYEVYMGRWSRALSRVFLEWLQPEAGAHWLEIGCGTGALTAAILDVVEPASVVACDPSEPFIQHARRSLSERCTFHVIASPNAFPSRPGGFDTVVSGLVLNFIPEPKSALEAMRERTREGATLAAYVWDYAGGVEFLRYFWEEAVSLDRSAASLDESRRFSGWDGARLTSLFDSAGLSHVETAVLELTTEFSSFDDYWRPFLGRSGPAPSYVAALAPAARELLRSRLEARIPSEPDGRMLLRARAFAVRGTNAGQPLRG